VHHSGSTLSGGHYTSFGQLPSGTWYKHNDATWWTERRTIPNATTLATALSTGYIYVYVREP
jgi:ubiquitin C-terminal hydrolase